MLGQLLNILYLKVEEIVERSGGPHRLLCEKLHVLSEITSRSSTSFFQKAPPCCFRNHVKVLHTSFFEKSPVVFEITSRSSTSVFLQKAPCCF